MRKLIEYIRSYYNDNSLFISDFLVPLIFVIAGTFIGLFMMSCKRENPPIEPRKEVIQDSIREVVSQKKMNYILQVVKEK